MVKIYFIGCAAVIEGAAKKYIELEKGVHELIVLPLRAGCGAVCRTLTVTAGGVTCDSPLDEGMRLIRISDGGAYAAFELFPSPMPFPEVVAQTETGGYLLTEWLGGRRYLTVEKDDKYCNLILRNGGSYDAKRTEGGALIVTAEKRITIIGADCDIIADVNGDYDVGDKIQIVSERGGIVGRTILENYAPDGRLIGRKVVRNTEAYPSELKAHAFIEAFIVGDLEFAHNMMTAELSESLDEVAEFIGRPLRIVTDELPFEEGLVLAEYDGGSIKAFRIKLDDGLIADANVDE